MIATTAGVALATRWIAGSVELLYNKNYIEDESLEIVWDEPKRLLNIQKHGLDFADLTLDFFASADIRAAKLGRMIAVGDWRGNSVILVVHRRLGSQAISIISMRPANARERNRA